MKKKSMLLTLSLISSVSLGALASCGSLIPELNEKDGVVLTYNGTEYTIDDMYKEYDGSIDSAKAYYNTLKDLFVQIVVDDTALIETTVENKIDDFYETARDNASANGTSEKEEIEKAFETEGVEDEEELRHKYTLEEKKSTNTTNLESDKNVLTYRKDYINNNSPYVAKHILVKVDASSTDLYNGKISADDAYQIYNVVKGLASTSTYKNFGEVALRLSEDGSNTTYGLLTSPMEITTSYVNEFKLGLYARDYLFNPNVKDNAGSTQDKTNLVENTNMPTDAEEVLNVQDIIGNQDFVKDESGTGVAAFGIPVSAALDLGTYAETTKSSADLTVEDAVELNYPRNIIYNHYFNNRSVSYIYLDSETEAQATNLGIDTSRFVQVPNLQLVEYVDDKTGDVGNQTTTTGVKLVQNAKVLADEKGNPIMVTRAGTSGDSGYEGIHFIVTAFDPFESVETQISNPVSESKYDYTSLFEGLTTNEDKASAVRQDYFNLTIPSLNTSDTTVYNPSLITSLTATESKNYSTLANAVRTALKNSYGTNLEFVQYNLNKTEAVNKGAVIPEAVDELVTSYINATMDNKLYQDKKSLASSWEDYLQLVDLQKSLSNRILPNSCIDEFMSGTITKGGVCDVSNN